MKIHNEHLLPPSRPPEAPTEPSPHAAAHLAWVARTVPCPAGCTDENLDCVACGGRVRVTPEEAEQWRSERDEIDALVRRAAEMRERRPEVFDRMMVAEASATLGRLVEALEEIKLLRDAVSRLRADLHIPVTEATEFDMFAILASIATAFSQEKAAERGRCARLCRSLDATERMMIGDGGTPSGLASKCADAILSIGPQCDCGDIMHPAYPPCVQCRKCFGCCMCEAKLGDAAQNGTPLIVACPSCHGDPIDGQWCCGACNGSGRVLARPLIVG